MLRKYKSLYSSTTNTFSTGESVTITPASVVGLPTDTEITLTFDRVDGSGTKTPDKMERIRGTIVGSNFVVSSGGRSVEGTEQVHTSPVVEMIWNADDWNDSVDWGLVEHGQDGKHSSALVTTLKASGAVVNTGTSDDTIVTPKALADSDYAKTTDITVTADSTTTFTNKTLTSPKINEDVVLTATSTQLNSISNISLDGWTVTASQPTYASANTMTVPSGAVSIYQKGDKVRFKQGAGFKYMYITVVADTLLTLTGGTDFTVDNSAITEFAYSHESSPVGFPQIFNLTAPIYTTTGTAFTNVPTTSVVTMVIYNNIIIIELLGLTNATSGGTGQFIATFNSSELPALNGRATGTCYNISTAVGGVSVATGSPTNYSVKFSKYDGTAIAGNSNFFQITLTSSF